MRLGTCDAAAPARVCPVGELLGMWRVLLSSQRCPHGARVPLVAHTSSWELSVVGRETHGASSDINREHFLEPQHRAWLSQANRCHGHCQHKPQPAPGACCQPCHDPYTRQHLVNGDSYFQFLQHARPGLAPSLSGYMGHLSRMLTVLAVKGN